MEHRVEAVTLRPMAMDELPAMRRFFEDAEAAGPYAWASPSGMAELEARFQEDGFLEREPFHLAIAADERFVGFVSWHSIPTGQGSWCWNIGVGVLPEYRGRGYATASQRQLAARLFSTTAANRIEATTDVEHLAEQRSLIKAGFTREGVLRGHQQRNEEWHDMVIFSRLRTDPDPETSE